LTPTDGVLGLKFADRTFRFVQLSEHEDGPRLTAAGAGLIPFNTKYRGQLSAEGADRLRDALDRALDRDGIERGRTVVVLDGVGVLRTVFPVTAAESKDADGLLERAQWELDRRRTGTDPGEGLHVACAVRGIRGEYAVADAWGAYPGTLETFDRVVQGVGCQIALWDCDPWALGRLFERYTERDERQDPAVVVHLEAEGMVLELLDAAGAVGLTAPRAEEPGPFRRTWDPDDPEEVAHEIARWIGKLRERWLPGTRQDLGEVVRLLFTGSVDDSDRLLAALARALPMRVEELQLQRILGIAPGVANSPMIRSNLGAFAFPVGGALALLNP
jgi:hypothetical protein